LSALAAEALSGCAGLEEQRVTEFTMKTRAVCMTVLTFAVTLVLGASAAAQQLPKSG